MIKGIISSKNQVTIPLEVRSALRLKVGDQLEWNIVGQSVTVARAKPDIEAALREAQTPQNIQALQDWTGGDTLRFLREMRDGDPLEQDQ